MRKSTYAKKLKDENDAVILSIDELREGYIIIRRANSRRSGCACRKLIFGICDKELEITREL